eukprot:c20844_g1_i2.p1 GENE.c20844_g1_i2~~c20844_g1_i2.p1  ORF type:complete len:574 (-),score=218.83 c20844_g1_i2:33-1754(-)
MLFESFFFILFCYIKDFTFGYESGTVIEFADSGGYLGNWTGSLGILPLVQRPPSYWKDSVYVHLDGVVTTAPGKYYSPNPIFQLPSGYRPAFTHYFVTIPSPSLTKNDLQSNRVIISVNSNGYIDIVDGVSGTEISASLDGIRFAWSYTDPLGATVDTSLPLYTRVNLTSIVSTISNTQIPSLYFSTTSGITYFQGAVSLSNLVSCSYSTGGCNVGSIDLSYIPIGFKGTETAAFPQSGSAYLEIFVNSTRAYIQYYSEEFGDMVIFDGVILLPTSINTASSQSSTQSSIASGSKSGYAVDSLTQTCATTNYNKVTLKATELPWWRVDLGQTVKVDFIRILGGCCDPSLSLFELRVGLYTDLNNGNSNPLCGGSAQSTAMGKSLDVSCGGMYGRYVNVRRTSISSALTICEIEVFGTTTSVVKTLAMSIITPKYYNLLGGWIEWTGTTISRVFRADDSVVCLSGRLWFSVSTESFNGQLIATLAQGWLPSYRTKFASACYYDNSPQTCAILIETTGELYALTGEAQPEKASGVGSWISLSGVCFGGSVYTAEMKLEGSSNFEMEGDSYIGIEQ